jgi:hypothetical protein
MRIRHLLIAVSSALFLASPATAAVDPATAEVGEPSGTSPVTISAVRPYQPGDHVWLTPPPVSELRMTAVSSGCQRVPSTGYIGTNVYADSVSQYSNYWSWGPASSGQPFYWYVKRNDNSNADNGYSSGGGGSSSIGANIYHWKVQNQGVTPQAWNVCWDVL